MISEQELLEIENRVRNASPGIWKASLEGRDHESGSHFIMIGDANDRLNDIELKVAKLEDYDFIANAKQDIPKLINEIRLLKSQLK